MNFITNLSSNIKEKTAFNSILIIINRFTKFVRYITINKTITTEELAFIFKKRIISNFNILNNIVFNQDFIFILYF